MVTRVSEVLDQKENGVVTIKPSATVYEAIGRMVEHGIGSVVVVDGSELVGIFTERDYLRRIVLQGRTSKTTDVSEVMTSDLIVVAPQHTVEEAMSLMSDNRCRHMPVVSKGDLVGMLSMGDCVRQVIEDREIEIRSLTDYIVGTYPK